jgi:hypothetical protein
VLTVGPSCSPQPRQINFKKWRLFRKKLLNNLEPKAEKNAALQKMSGKANSQ